MCPPEWVRAKAWPHGLYLSGYLQPCGSSQVQNHPLRTETCWWTWTFVTALSVPGASTRRQVGPAAPQRDNTSQEPHANHHHSEGFCKMCVFLKSLLALVGLALHAFNPRPS